MYMYLCSEYSCTCIAVFRVQLYSKACKKLHILDIILVHKNLFFLCRSTKPTEAHMYDNCIDLELPLFIDQIVAHE